MNELKSIIELVSGVGVIGILIITLFGVVWKRWWVPFWMYEKMERERDEWKQLALQNMHTARYAVSVTEKVVDATLPSKSGGG